MESSAGDLLDEVDLQPIEMLRAEVLREFGGTDVVANMLRLPPDSDLGDADVDHLSVLSEIMATLTDLCGGQQNAIRWLINNPRYKAIAGTDPYYCLEQGTFWSMSTMLDWLLIVSAHRSCDLLSGVFGFRERDQQAPKRSQGGL